MTKASGGQLYVTAVTAAGLMVLGHCISSVVTDPIGTEWLILAGLTLLTGKFTIKVPTLAARISVSETFVFTSVLLFGTCAGTITVALDALIAALGPGRHTRQPIRILFNLAAGTISIWTASHAFYSTAGINPLSDGDALHLPTIVGPLILLTLTYFFLNSFLVAAALAFDRNVGWFGIWRRNFLWLGVNYFGGASVAVLLVSYTRHVDLTALGIIVPLLVISYLTFKTSLGRLDDATKHVEEVQRLYLSTIETLATAIDAKDQVTHGHIRRVQRFALGLARELGVRDEKQLKALEAAALLHDTGKLVVPEHILNKPGQLTRGEFEKMKLHASVGADILSSIQFPYPVVPIVRHHHESWDGSGYPDGLRGTEIPIGARILAVADCFDALTSDRPYRRRLTDDEAIKILVERRGKMYDPLVVDTFAAVKDKLSESLTESVSEIETVLGARRISKVDSERLVRIDKTDPRNIGLIKLIEEMLPTLRHSANAKLAVFFVPDHGRDKLTCVAAAIESSLISLDVHMDIGARVSGWVAANRRPIINADAALDLLKEASRLDLRRCLCVPVIYGGHVLAVVSLYTSDDHGFTEQDLVLAETMARSLDVELLTAFVDNQDAHSRRVREQTVPTVH